MTRVLPSTVDLSVDLMPTMAAAAAMVHEGGLDTFFATELADALAFGWKADEEAIRRTNDLLGLDETLPSWLLSTFRDNMRTEVSLIQFGLVPLHTIFIARALPTANRVSRLVIHFANLGDAGVEALAVAVSRGNCPLRDLHLVAVGMGDKGLAALAASLVTNRKLDLLNIESNHIGDLGAVTLADSLRHNRSLAEVKLADNYVGAEGVAALSSVFAAAPRRLAYLTGMNKQRACATTAATTQPRAAPHRPEYTVRTLADALALARPEGRSGHDSAKKRGNKRI